MALVFAYYRLVFLVFSWHFLRCQTSPLSVSDVRVPREHSKVPGLTERGEGDEKTDEKDDFIPYTYIIEYTRSSEDDTLASASHDDAPVQVESHAHAGSSSTSHQPRLVSEDVTKKVAIYIEEGYDRGAYDHRGYDKVSKGWNDHLEYDHKRYGGVTTSGDEAGNDHDSHGTTKQKYRDDPRAQETRDLHQRPRFLDPQDVAVPPLSRHFSRPRLPSFRLLPPPPLPVRKGAVPRGPTSRDLPRSRYGRGRSRGKGGGRASRDRERGEPEDVPSDAPTPFEFVLPEDLRSNVADLDGDSGGRVLPSRDRGAAASHLRSVSSQRYSGDASAASSRGNDEVIDYISNADPDDPRKPWYAIVTRKAAGGGGAGEGRKDGRGIGKEGRDVREELEGGERKGQGRGDRHRSLAPPGVPDGAHRDSIHAHEPCLSPHRVTTHFNLDGWRPRRGPPAWHSDEAPFLGPLKGQVDELREQVFAPVLRHALCE